MLKIGDIVTRKKYNHDILFRIDKIVDNIAYLSGVDLRLCADAEINDLVISNSNRKKEQYNIIKNLDINRFFYIPGSVLHLDSDSNYLEKCLEYYKREKVKCNGYIFKESDYPHVIKKLIEKHKPNVIVITGHDSFNIKNNKYKNSAYFEETVKISNSISKQIIISGACQSNFEGLIKSGATFASSPARINIHALDPAIIACYVAKTDRCEKINLEEVLSKTKYGDEGIGGIISYGVMITGAPRKGKNWILIK